MAANLKKGRNRLSLMLSFGSTHDASPKNRSAASQTSSMGSINVFGLSSTTSLPVTPSHITPSPHSPLLASPSPLSPLNMENPAPLPTVNDLGAQEKMRLLKQARKISQIFGEMPSMKEEDIQPSYRPSRDMTRPAQRPARSSSLMPAGNKLQRPAHRTRSRPTLNVRPASPTLPKSPTPQAAPPVPEIPVSASASTPSSTRTTPRSKAPPLPPAITVPTPRKSLDARSERSAQSTRSKAPPALPVDPASPSAAQVLAQGNTAQLTRSNSARSMRGRNRGRSMEYARPDARPRVNSTARPSTASSAKRPSTAPRDEMALQRSRSLWESKGKLEGAGQREDVKSDRDAVIRDLKENSHFGDSQRMTRTQRSLSIKRARKLNHMFGSEPPQALYVSSFVEKRLSGATIYSISSSADLLSVQNPATRAAKHHSITSVSTTSEPSSPVATTHNIPPMKGHRRMPSTPAAPVTDARASDPHGEEDDTFPEQEPSEVFRQRRTRAAKLSRFFGVDLHDISQSLGSAPPAPRPSVAIAPVDTTPTKVPPRPHSPEGVDVRIQQSSKFWSRHDHRREVDMNDVINRLREMR